MPLVSIIIPSYNRADLILETLASVKEQTHQNWECIVVDDGSTDNTEEIVLKLAAEDSRFKYFNRPEDKPKGANACRNFGLQQSQGTYINFLDSDDILSSSKLNQQIESLEENVNACYCICQTEWVEKDSGNSLGLRSKAITSENRREDYMMYKIFWSIHAPLWRKAFIVENDLKFDENLKQSQEYDFHLKALSIDSDYMASDKVLAQMFKHDNNLSNNWMFDQGKLLSNITVKKRILNEEYGVISDKTRFKIVEILTLLYKDILKTKQFKSAKQIQKLLEQEVKHRLKLDQSTRKSFISKMRKAYWSYKIFGRGYNILSPLAYTEVS
ncbi:glycosyltransferase [Winogradskyella sp. 3972H.M.0a.05]|uniref:glycosyltransferase family 2 protein n=1 Tax=Winogradskyella sp. 3972H.M.0a.05 TaxID=2950277 RepID=UPI00339AA9C0